MNWDEEIGIKKQEQQKANTVCCILSLALQQRARSGFWEPRNG